MLHHTCKNHIKYDTDKSKISVFLALGKSKRLPLLKENYGILQAKPYLLIYEGLKSTAFSENCFSGIMGV